MPGGDRTGPAGRGPMTGRAARGGGFGRGGGRRGDLAEDLHVVLEANAYALAVGIESLIN